MVGFCVVVAEENDVVLGELVSDGGGGGARVFEGRRVGWHAEEAFR